MNMNKKNIIILSIVLLVIVVVGLYYAWINLVHSAKYSPTFMCDWRDRIKTTCIDKINRSNITKEELKIIMKEERINKADAILFVNAEINNIETWIEGNINADEMSIRFKESELLRLKTARDILLDTE
jgi:hypothetical protein